MSKSKPNPKRRNKPGAGRPALVGVAGQFLVRLTAPQLAKLQKIKIETGATQSQIVRDAIDDYSGCRTATHPAPLPTIRPA